ncbi:MAG: YggS family pyridoxal phosphate-dependent enzyme [Porphyromonadaceae bacterium]|nr:YggS family pyridoxal phosphate-dependent enzyme [Porphyromonadaceae bacterium]
MSVLQNIQEIRKHIPTEIKLVCVSKFHPEATIMEAYNAGERNFGESRVQELISKQPNLPDDIQWHFIGHLQRNKIKNIISFVSLIHGVDSLRVLKEINRQAEMAGRTVSCLLQVHIAEEESKFGFTESELIDLLSSDEIAELKNTSISGLMGMATYTNDTEQVRNEFRTLKKFFDRVKTDFFAENDSFRELSMGMSQDYHIAVEEGSTMIRIGTSIFGEREY